MDTVSHALWGFGLFGYRRFPWLAAFFGAFPDLVSFGVLFIKRIVTGEFHFGAPPLDTIPQWVFISYNYSHSFIIAFLFLGIVSIFRKNWAFAMLGWPFHILLDFPFHTKAYFPTKLFWPLSNITIDGIPWTHPAIWFPNLAGIIILFFWRWRLKRGAIQSSLDKGL
ncbi:MAG TPA: hypothetical protein EYN82_04740 [Candidatus Marinimicrobia bacterium]|nr:hypothetical protein [Candidatus Neomarinimicrobiota bacterium]